MSIQPLSSASPIRQTTFASDLTQVNQTTPAVEKNPLSSSSYYSGHGTSVVNSPIYTTSRCQVATKVAFIAVALLMGAIAVISLLVYLNQVQLGFNYHMVTQMQALYTMIVSTSVAIVSLAIVVGLHCKNRPAQLNRLRSNNSLTTLAVLRPVLRQTLHTTPSYSIPQTNDSTNHQISASVDDTNGSADDTNAASSRE